MKRKQLLIVLLVAAFSAFNSIKSEIQQPKAGLRQLHLNMKQLYNGSKVFENCDANYIRECHVVDQRILDAIKHREQLGSIAYLKKELSETQNNYAQKVVAGRIAALEQNYPHHDKATFRDTLSSQEQEELDNAVCAVLNLNDLPASKVGTEAHYISDLLK